ncbi:MAG: hypothetical protein KBA26_12780 [Candidatus Delongbacteria bacterium]|nr:hypothetical protein [Candidatus Delongbacteria bacterium]
MNRWTWNLPILVLLLILLQCHQDEKPVSDDVIPYPWSISTPQAEQIDPVLLDSAFYQIGQKGYINAVLIIRHGRIAAERYYNGRDAADYQTVRSVSKSFLSALIGIAI